MKRPVFARLSGVLLCLLLAAGCASLKEVVNLGSRVQDAGYTDVSVNHNTSNGFDTVTINANKPSTTETGEDIARLVWDTYPEEVDRLVVTVNGRTRSATSEELEKLFGPRKVSVVDDGPNVGAIVAWVFLGLLLVVVVVVVLIVRGNRRRRREQMMQPPPYPPFPYT